MNRPRTTANKIPVPDIPVPQKLVLPDGPIVPKPLRPAEDRRREADSVPVDVPSEDLQAKNQAGYLERKSEKPFAPVDMPPLMVNKVQNVSKLFNGVIFAFRGNASLPRYLAPSAPKPSSVKAKTCKRHGFMHGLIPVDSAHLGNIVRDDKAAHIVEYKPKDLEHPPNSDVITTPHVQLDYSVMQVMEGIKKGDYEIVSTPAELKAGQLKVKELKDIDVHGGIIYGIDLLKDKNEAKPPLAQVEHQQWRVEEKFSMPAPPDWWNPEFGNWSQQAECRYPAFYQTSASAESKPLMVYGRESDKGVLPITGDQDLLWITIPVKGLEEFKLPPSMFETINTFDSGGPKILGGPAKMQIKLAELSAHFAKINRPDLCLAHIDIKPDVLARMGIATPYEVYVAIFVNKAMGLEADHVRDLIQHGCDNRNPGPPSSLNDKINHISADRQWQTRTEEELVSLATSSHYRGHVIDMHAGWGEKMNPVIKDQMAIRAEARFAPLSDQLTVRFAQNSPQLRT